MTPLQPTTAADLAKHLGLSPSTVSVVLSGQAERRKIPLETVKRVQEAAQKLNYVPNQWARNLRRQRSGMVGVVLASFRWDWAQELICGMTEVLDGQGCTPFVAVHLYDPARARRELLACVQRRDEVIITVPLPGLEDVYSQAQRVGVPVVFVGDRPATLKDAHFVAWDSPTDTRLAIQHLIEIGRQRIGFVGFDYPMPLNLARYEAYRSTLRTAGLQANARWVARLPMMLSPDEIVAQAMVKLLDTGPSQPDAVFVQHDGLATLLLDAMRTRGVRIPEQVALIGMGDYPITRHRGISLTTMKEPIAEIGRHAAHIAIELMAAPSKDPIQRLLPCGELMVRETTRV